MDIGTDESTLIANVINIETFKAIQKGLLRLKVCGVPPPIGHEKYVYIRDYREIITYKLIQSN